MIAGFIGTLFDYFAQGYQKFGLRVYNVVIKAYILTPRI